MKHKIEQNLEERKESWDNDYWYWKSGISHEDCQKIINLSEDSWNLASTFG